jgi:hypothetical protein
VPEPLAPPFFFPAGERPRGLGDGAMAAACPFDKALMPLVRNRTAIYAGGRWYLRTGDARTLERKGFCAA